MASKRPFYSSAFLILVFLVTSIIGLFLLQTMVHRARQDQQQLVANLVVRLNDRTPHHLDLRLLPQRDGALSAGRFGLLGEAPLRVGHFPWKEAPIVGRLELDLDSAPFTELHAPFTLTSGGGGLVARYAERVMGGDQQLLDPVPCLGRLEVSRVVLGDGKLERWDQVELLQGQLELQCHGSGRDRVPSTDDDLHFALLGTVDYRFGDPT